MRSMDDFVFVKNKMEKKKRRQKLIDESIFIGCGLIFYGLILKVIL